MENRCDTVRYVIGLGNPGQRYRNTRHNVGFLVLRELRRRWNFGSGRSKFHARIWTGTIGRTPVRLVAPQTYMNRSGLAVAELTAFYRVSPEAMLVVMDDMALRGGRLRVRAGGSAGGHKGLADIVSALGTDAVARLRVGISAPPEEMAGTDYVLGEFDESEKMVISQAIARAADAVHEWVEKGVISVMNRYNQDDGSPDEVQGNGKDL